MCMPYLGKLFSGGHRRRNNSSGTPRPSLAPTPQQSSATIRTTSNTANMAVVQKNSISPVGTRYSGLLSEAPGIIPNASSGGEILPVEAATPTTSMAATVPPRPTSWWDFLGFARSKKNIVGPPSAFR